MPTWRAVILLTRMWRAISRPARARDSLVVIAGAVICAGLIFGLLYDVSDRALRHWADRDLERHANLIGVAMAPYGHEISRSRLHRALDSFATGSDLVGLVVCSPEGAPIGMAGGVEDFDCRSALAGRAMSINSRTTRGRIGARSVLVTAQPLGVHRLLIVQDRTFLDARRKHLLQMLFGASELAVLALLLLARAGARIGSRRTQEAVRAVVRQIGSNDINGVIVPAELRLLVRDVHDTVEQLRKQRPLPGIDAASRLRALVAAEVSSGGLVVVANREPYAHEWSPDGNAVVRQPASGLVTGVEPMLRACGGTWIARGSGSADRAHSDRSGRLAVPPDGPEYVLRRLWIDEDEYERYYSGLANEMLWPLCHMVHTQPSFRAVDWIAYQAVNERFARAAIEEANPDGLLLIQDYHFALVPRLVRRDASHIVTSLFWHIPWPNSEVFGICPWKEALLEGMIGADIVGFHTRRYCLNFLETVQRYLECRVDPDEMSISYGGHRTLVRAYPISVEWPYPSAPRMKGHALRKSIGITPEMHVSLGVDRADYTKGLIERIAAVELLLEENPSLVGKYVLVQLASPTRSRIRKYQEFVDNLNQTVDRVNARFGTASWKPVVLQMRTFSCAEVREHYAMADSALVTPLHDGMNLVSKEYVAACDDGDGVLVLSEFAGAAKELDGALLVNPYDTEQVAHAILRAIRMPFAERRARMHAMREHIAANSIYQWSEKLLSDMLDVRKHRARFWPQRMAEADLRQREFAG